MPHYLGILLLCLVFQSTDRVISYENVSFYTEQPAQAGTEERIPNVDQVASKESIVINVLFVFFLISLVSIFLTHRNYRLKNIANEKLSNVINELEETNRIKNQLFSIISHDLRGPLSTLQGIVTLMEMKAVSQKEIQDMLPDVVDQFKSTSNFLNNLLNWAKSQMDGFQVKPTTMNLAEAVQKNIELLRSRFGEKEIVLHVAYPGNTTVFADENMIDLVILNLLANAIKFSHQGDQLSIRFESDGNEIRTYISDTGIGIPKDKIENIFSNNFFSTRGTDNETGTGLGLMLCRDFINRNNGSIGVESTEGKGTTFWFSLPVKEDLSETHSAAGHPVNGSIFLGQD